MFTWRIISNLHIHLHEELSRKLQKHNFPLNFKVKHLTLIKLKIFHITILKEDLNRLNFILN